MKQRLLIATIILMIILGTIASAATIKDVPKDHWAYQSVKKLVDEGLLQLYDDDTFRGNDKVSRYQLAAIIARVLEEIDSGNVQASAKDMELLRKLSGEFQDELVNLAVQGEAFAKQIKEIKQKNIIQDEFLTEIKDQDIASLNDKISELNEKITNVESDVSQIIDSILKIKQIEERISSIEAVNTEQTSQIEENKQLITELKEVGLQNADDTIEELKNRISVNKTRINSLQQEVNSLKSELEDKKVQLSEMENEKANNQNYMYGIAGVALLLLLLSN